MAAVHARGQGWACNLLVPWEGRVGHCRVQQDWPEIGAVGGGGGREKDRRHRQGGEKGDEGHCGTGTSISLGGVFASLRDALARLTRKLRRELPSGFYLGARLGKRVGT